MYTEINKIVVPTDFSSLANRSIEQAVKVAHQFGASITLLHVMETYAHNSVIEGTYEEMLEDAIQEKLNQKIQQLKEQNSLTVMGDWVQGKIYSTISQYVREKNIDLVVMGTHGASGVKNLKRYWLGTNTYRVVSIAPCPILTVPEGGKVSDFKNIALPLDITKETKPQVSTAILMAKVFGATLHVSTVSTFLEEFVVDFNKIRQLLQETTDALERANIDHTSKIIRHEQIADSILKHSEEVHADLVIMATQQKNKWNERLLGSTAKRVVTNSNIPVLAINPYPRQPSPLRTGVTHKVQHH